mgnify:CR=1 FL=1
MFGSLTRRYFRRRPGRFATYRSKGLKRYSRGRHMTRRGRRVPPRNRYHTVVHRRDSIAPSLVSASTDQAENLRFALNTFPGTGPFQALYHQYRILKVKVEYIPVNYQARHQLDGEQPTDTFTPTIYTAINRTASAFPATVTDFMSMNSCKFRLAGRYHKRYFTPSTLDTVYNTALSSGYNPEYKQWISMGYPSAPHFGLDTLLSATASSAGTFKYRRVETIWVQYKNRKPNTSTSLSLPIPEEPREVS